MIDEPDSFMPGAVIDASTWGATKVGVEEWLDEAEPDLTGPNCRILIGM